MADRRHRVRWSEAAAADLAGIVGYIARRSPINARKVLGRLKRAASALGRQPRRGRVVPELARIGARGWREVITRPYRVIYKVEGRTVHVLAVVDGRRDLEDLLLERLTR